MRTFFSVVGILLAIALAAVGVLGYVTSTVTGVADRFFAAGAAGDLDEARALLSEDFRQSTPDGELAAFLAALSLDGFRGVSWTTRDIRPNSSELEGALLIGSGQPVPVEVELLRHGAEWRIHSIRQDQPGISRVAGGIPVPGIRQAQSMVMRTTTRFADAVKAKDFTDFYENAAATFRERYSLEEFTRLFSGFIEKNVDLTVLAQLQPRLTAEPALLADGLLQLQGYFPTRPARAYFAYQYTYGIGGWTLTGIDFKLTNVSG
ncbi:MAG: hypothetical protein DWQ08_07095 [Proteobacteria bacterium]|nr:MAG: hypothetical protein DWQ08_07095 [Pseudomonadota bacterium]